MEEKKEKKNKFLYYIELSLDLLGKILPISKYRLPLRFQGKHFYTSKRITFFSILIFAFILWNSIQILMNVG